MSEKSKFVRGYFTHKTPWSKDFSKKHFEGFWMEVFWPCLKYSVISVILVILVRIFKLDIKWAILICIAIILGY